MIEPSLSQGLARANAPRLSNVNTSPTLVHTVLRRRWQPLSSSTFGELNRAPHGREKSGARPPLTHSRHELLERRLAPIVDAGRARLLAMGQRLQQIRQC